jgi:hypothetical protein
MRLKTAIPSAGWPAFTLHQPVFFFFCWSLHFCLAGSGSWAGNIVVGGSDNFAHLARFGSPVMALALHAVAISYYTGNSLCLGFSAAARSRPIQLEAATGSITGMYCGNIWVWSASSLRHYRAVDFGGFSH